MVFLNGSVGKESTCNGEYEMQERRLDPWFGNIPSRRNWQLIPVFLLGELHRQRSPVGYSPKSHKESDRTERLSTNTHTCKVSIK